MNIFSVKQKLNNKLEIKDPYIKAKNEMLQLLKNVDNNKKVGITVGSRGINDIDKILKAIVDAIKENNLIPILIPSMGTHGGANINSQINILNKLKINKSNVGANIHKSLDTYLVGNTSSSIPVYVNSIVKNIDFLVVVNRVKAHTDFEGEIESGLCKMLAVGLGAEESAKTIHEFSIKKGYVKTIKDVTKFLLNTIPILGGIGIVEGKNNRPIIIESIHKNNILKREKELIIIAKENSIKLPLDNLDILMVNEIGKNISGTGMDTNIIGRRGIVNQPEPKNPNIERIIVLDITPQSDGNAIGIGLADMITENLFKKIDIHKTSLNSLGSFGIEQGKIPCVLENDQKALETAIETIFDKSKENINLIFIKNTSELKEMYMSESLYDFAKNHKDLIITGEVKEIKFDIKGNIIKYFN